jgi:AcrR family transcriptional regulator
MSRVRLSREESREQTRRRLIAAAAAIIAKKGLAATSVEEIAAKAGFTRGAFYSNFSDKTDLFAELLQIDHKRSQASLRSLLEKAESSKDPQLELASLYAQSYRDNSHYILWAEARLYAMRDEAFRQRMNVLCLERRDTLARFTELLYARLGMLPYPCFADHAFALIALIDGAHYFRMAMPNEVPRTLIEALFAYQLPGPIADVIDCQP